MVSLIKKKKKGRVYYYLAESQRVNGKPRIVWQKYLGTPERLKAILQQGEEGITPQEIQCFEFGAVVALLRVTEELGLAEIIDSHTDKRSNLEVTVGEYLLLIILNRCLAPRSKNKLAGWYSGTVLPRLLKIQPSRLKSQNFWAHMCYLEPPQIEGIEEEICQVVVEKFGLREDLGTLFYDPTNFYTFIEEHEDPGNINRLPQRGHNKAQRFDLRQINLALLVTKGQVPLFHATYPGNVNDITQFKATLRRLRERSMQVFQSCGEITIIFDKGNNSKENVNSLKPAGYHFVGGLKPSHHRDLLEIPLAQYSPLPGQDQKAATEKILGYREEQEVFGITRTIVVTHDPKLSKRQEMTLERLLQKKMDALRDLQGKLNQRKWKKPPAVQKKLQGILGSGGYPRAVRTLIQVDLSGSEGELTLEFRINSEKCEEVAKAFGKTILFTDQHEWSTAEIVKAYRDKHQIEACIRRIKSPEMIRVMPMFHWTDQKIRVHVFTCVLALLLLMLLHQRVKRSLTEAPCLAKTMEALKGIKEVVFQIPRRRHLVMRLTKKNKLQEDLFQALNLEKYQARPRG